MDSDEGLADPATPYAVATSKPSPHFPAVTAFSLAPTLGEEMSRADLVISHGGAGSITEALRLGKPLIVAVNTALMDNHQAELATALRDRGNCLLTLEPVRELAGLVEGRGWCRLLPKPARDRSGLLQAIAETTGAAFNPVR